MVITKATIDWKKKKKNNDGDDNENDIKFRKQDIDVKENTRKKIQKIVLGVDGVV